MPNEKDVDLIAAAPEMLAALEGLVNALGQSRGAISLVEVRALIAKARGEVAIDRKARLQATQIGHTRERPKEVNRDTHSE